MLKLATCSFHLVFEHLKILDMGMMWNAKWICSFFNKQTQIFAAPLKSAKPILGICIRLLWWLFISDANLLKTKHLQPLTLKKTLFPPAGHWITDLSYPQSFCGFLNIMSFLLRVGKSHSPRLRPKSFRDSRAPRKRSGSPKKPTLREFWAFRVVSSEIPWLSYHTPPNWKRNATKNKQPWPLAVVVLWIMSPSKETSLRRTQCRCVFFFMAIDPLGCSPGCTRGNFQASSCSFEVTLGKSCTPADRYPKKPM